MHAKVQAAELIGLEPWGDFTPPRPEGQPRGWGDLLFLEGLEGRSRLAGRSRARLQRTDPQVAELAQAAELLRLKREVMLLWHRIAELSASRDARPGPAVPVAGLDPRLAWCEANREVLRNLHDAFAAISADQGLIASGASVEELQAKLVAVDPRSILVVATDDFRA
jgi:hypothetical protein